MHSLGPALLVSLATCQLLACQRNEPTTTQPPEAAQPEEDPDAEAFAFVSSDNNAQPDTAGEQEQTNGGPVGFEVTTVTQARELAEEAVYDQLNPKQQWKTSPVLPAKWPSNDAEAMFLFYPMALHPKSMERYELYSAAWVVVVALTDGTTEITPIAKSRRLGTIEDGRPTSLERRELELAEEAMMVLLLGGDSQAGENRFWGYLKYFHEHPKIGADIKKRRPRFVKWLKGRPHHT